jgi:hypothetical protein
LRTFLGTFAVVQQIALQNGHCCVTAKVQRDVCNLVRDQIPVMMMDELLHEASSLEDEVAKG